MTNSLVQFWDKFEFGRAPYIHPKDRERLSPNSHENHFHDGVMDFDGFVDSSRFGDFKGTKFDLSLLPQPYSGDLDGAEIVILLLNPGFGFTDYYGEYRMAGFRRRLEETIRQSLNSQPFPFLWLDPELCWHGGFVWWEKKLRQVLTEIARVYFDKSYRRAMRDLSHRLACVELIPYHSINFGGHSLESQLPSVKAAKTYVKDILEREAVSEKKLIIITRKIKSWGELKSCKNIVNYNGYQARGASFGHATPGGSAILEWYRRHPPSL